MTAHRLALLLRAGAVAALAAGGLAVVASPAYAAPTIVLSSSSFDMGAGDAKNLKVTISDTPNSDVTFTIDAPSINDQITLKTDEADCDKSGTSLTCTDMKVPVTGSVAVTFQIIAKNPSGLQPGETKTANGTVKVNGGPSPSYSVKLKGPAAPATSAAASTVPEVSGTVRDSATGKSVPDAAVVLKDGAGKTRDTLSDNNGKFRFTGNADNPIAPGQITITAGKDTYDQKEVKQTGRAGQALQNLDVRLKLLDASASAVPLPTAGEAEATPTVPVETGGVANPEAEKRSDESSPFSWVLIALGGLLVLFGIGAIVLLMRRNKDDSDDDEDDDEDGPPVRRGPQGGGGQRPGYRGAPNADPTMISRSPMGAPAMAGRGNANDATAIVRAPVLDDDYQVPPDPYAAPPRAGGYPPAAPAGPAAGYGDTPGGYGANGYGDQDGYGAGPGAGAGYGPSSRPAVDGYNASDYAGGGYGAGQPGAGYNDPPAYDQRGGYGEEPPTQRYEPGGGDGGYGPGAAPGGYAAPSAGNGYSASGPDYDAQPYAGRGGYEARGGYEPAAGYERDPYERAPEPPRAGAAYDQGYDERGGYGAYPDGANGAPPQGRQSPPPVRGGDRRSLDWLDD